MKHETLKDLLDGLGMIAVGTLMYPPQRGASKTSIEYILCVSYAHDNSIAVFCAFTLVQWNAYFRSCFVEGCVGL